MITQNPSGDATGSGVDNTDIVTQDSLETVTVLKSNLLKIVEANKQRHNEIYDTAIANFKEKTVELAMSKIQEFKDKPGNEGLFISFPVPISYEQYYNTVINKLKLSVASYVFLSSQEFSQYVENNWSWKNNFKSISSTYVSGCAIDTF
jgi:hypothetical protein